MFLQICDVTIASILSALSLLKGIQEEINYKVTVIACENIRFSSLFAARDVLNRAHFTCSPLEVFFRYYQRRIHVFNLVKLFYVRDHQFLNMLRRGQFRSL